MKEANVLNFISKTLTCLIKHVRISLQCVYIAIYCNVFCCKYDVMTSYWSQWRHYTRNVRVQVFSILLEWYIFYTILHSGNISTTAAKALTPLQYNIQPSKIILYINCSSRFSPVFLSSAPVHPGRNAGPSQLARRGPSFEQCRPQVTAINKGMQSTQKLMTIILEIQKLNLVDLSIEQHLRFYFKKARALFMASCTYVSLMFDEIKFSTQHFIELCSTFRDASNWPWFPHSFNAYMLVDPSRFGPSSTHLCKCPPQVLATIIKFIFVLHYADISNHGFVFFSVFHL